MTSIKILALALALPLPAAADLVKPDTRCGPEIPRESVTVLDISELPPEAGAEAIHKQFGEISVVRSTTIEARTALGRAWKRAEKEAAELGCPYVVLLQRERVTKGFVAMGTSIIPARRDSVGVWFAKPAPPKEGAGQ